VSAALADLAWPQAERARGAALVVPVGATEQHGPHLPVSTDTDIAVALAERLVAALPEAVLAPALVYGASGEHAGFAGTLSIGREATEHVLVELGRSAAESFARVVLVSAHGGNAEPVARATARLVAEGRDVVAWSPSWSGDAHAGRTETSVMLALCPERVRLGAAAAGATAPLAALWPALRTGGVRAVSANGVLGDPAGASAEEGRRLLAAAGADLLAAVGGAGAADAGTRDDGRAAAAGPTGAAAPPR
jgi:mycofactocin precursor peptide peptidase